MLLFIDVNENEEKFETSVIPQDILTVGKIKKLKYECIQLSS